MKKERGAITLFVIMGMLFFIIALINIYVMSVNRKQSQLQILEQANGAYDENAEDIYQSYFGDDLVNIYNVDQLLSIGSNQNIQVNEENGKIYNFKTNGVYVLRNNLSFSVADFMDKYPDMFEEVSTPGEVETETITNQVTEFGYTGSEQTYVTPYKGTYKLEVWGAQGGGQGNISVTPGGFGGYSVGETEFEQGISLYVYVGEFGDENIVYYYNRPFNGGGQSIGDGDGGGATDIRLVSGDWDDSESLLSRIIVAGRWTEEE